MEIQVSEVKDIKLLRIIGDLDTNTAPNAESEIITFLEQGVLKIIINLNETHNVSSAGLRVFLIAAKKLTAVGGAVKLCCPNKLVRETLEISGFTSILDVKETQEEAINSM